MAVGFVQGPGHRLEFAFGLGPFTTKSARVCRAENNTLTLLSAALLRCHCASALLRQRLVT